MRHKELVVSSLLAASLHCQTPAPPADARVPGTNLFRCATPEPRGLPTAHSPADCSYTATNPTAAYAPNDVISIPVVVHVIQSNSGAGNLSDLRVQSQIDVLNEDFRAAAGTPGGGGVDTKIEFQLATVDPAGNPTTGIQRYTNNTWFADAGSYWNQIAWPTGRYLNIYTNNVGNGSVLGYVPALPQQPGGVLGSNADRVVILHTAFGRPGSFAPFNQGRTCTHEVGHYLGLFHTFSGGCQGGSCYTAGDLICDTEAESNPRFGCPTGATSCGSPDPIRNYMDYTDDACMNQFTQEQARRMRCTLQYYRPSLGQSLAVATSYGTGCYDQAASFQETFPGATFDLGGSNAAPNVVDLVPTATGYTVQAGASAWFVPGTPDLGLADEQLASVTLPFAFAWPGGSTTDAQICSNGFVYLDSAATTTEPVPNLVFLGNGPARMAPIWSDLDPGLGGTCHYDVDPAGGAVYFTWLDVATAGGAGTVRVQLVLRQDGSASWRYGEVTGLGLTLAAYTPGSTPFVGSTDIGGSMPFPVGLELDPLTWTAVGRPVLGTTQVLEIGNPYDPNNSIGLAVLGWTEVAGGLDLGTIGAPGCRLYASTDIVDAFLRTNGVFSWSLAIPTSSSLEGVDVFTQGALLTNTVNALGLLTANGVKLTLDAN